MALKNMDNFVSLISEAEMGEDEALVTTNFFKIMLPGFDKRLKLPPAFCEKVKHEKSKRAILESCKGKWKINVCRENDDQIVLEDGWPRFADEHGLSLRDFLVFKHNGRLHFNVMIFDSTACLKKFLVESDDNEHQKLYTSYHAKKKTPLRIRSLCFSHRITLYTASKKGYGYIPKEFAKSNNLAKKKGHFILKDPRTGRKWRVKIRVQSWPYQFKVMMTDGWHDFVVDNNLQVGDLCTFQLNPRKSSTSENVYFDVRISRNTSR